MQCVDYQISQKTQHSLEIFISLVVYTVFCDVILCRKNCTYHCKWIQNSVIFPQMITKISRYIARFCKRIYKFTTHGDVAQYSGVQDMFHYVALRT